MKAFRFRLEPLLTLRASEEERIRSSHGSAVRLEQILELELRGVDARIEADFGAWRGVVTAGERVNQWEHAHELQRVRQTAVEKLAAAKRERELQMRRLLEAHRRAQTLETLKTRHRQAHLNDQRRREEREVEELVGARYQTTFGS